MNPAIQNIDHTYLDKLSESFERIISNQLSIAIWNLPGSTAINYLIGYLERTAVNKIPEQSFVIAPFNNKGQTYIIRPLENIKDIIDHQVNKKLWYCAQTNYHPDVSRNYYTKLVKDGIKAIQSGVFEKVVLSRQKEITLPSGFQPLHLFAGLVENYPSSFVSFISTPETGTWIGATPELLLKSSNEKYETVSLAGTYSNSHQNEPVSFSLKDKEEQEIVSKYIREVFQSEKIEYDQLDPEVLEAGHLHHIYSRFIGKHSERKAATILNKLHPTPAVNGYPKENALQFILERESYPRKLYSGFAGPYENEKNFEFYVNLRCMEVLDKTALFYAGAGIVKGSQPEAEYDETENKMKTLEKLL